jgi:callose synthase
MEIHVNNYQWHEFFPQRNISPFFITLCTFFHHRAITKSCLETGVVPHNIGVVISIWTPILLVSGLNMKF